MLIYTCGVLCPLSGDQISFPQIPSNKQHSLVDHHVKRQNNLTWLKIKYMQDVCGRKCEISPNILSYQFIVRCAPPCGSAGIQLTFCVCSRKRVNNSIHSEDAYMPFAVKSVELVAVQTCYNSQWSFGLWGVNNRTSHFCLFIFSLNDPEGASLAMGGQVTRFSWRHKCVLFISTSDCHKCSVDGGRDLYIKIASTCDCPSSSLGTSLFSGAIV
jgi:hypothetical protein